LNFTSIYFTDSLLFTISTMPEQARAQQLSESVEICHAFF